MTVRASGRIVSSRPSSSAVANSHRQGKLCQSPDGRVVLSLQPSLIAPPSPPIVIDLVTPPSSPDDSFTVVTRRFNPQSNRGVTVQPSSYEVFEPFVRSCGDGLFTTRGFKADAHVSEFIGERIDNEESNRRRSIGLGGYLECCLGLSLCL